MNIDFDKSDKKTKKFKIVLSIDGKKKTIHFGSKVSKTFVEGKKELYKASQGEGRLGQHKCWSIKSVYPLG